MTTLERDRSESATCPRIGRSAGVRTGAAVVGIKRIRRVLAAGTVTALACSRPSSDGHANSGDGSPIPAASLRALPTPKETMPPLATRLGVVAPGTGIPRGQQVPDVRA